MLNKLIAIYLLLICKFSSGQNLFLNPGFESNLNSWLSWSSVIDSTQFIWDNTVLHSGKASGKIISNLTSTDGACFMQIPTISEYASYELSYWIKTSSLEKYLFVDLVFKDSKNNEITRINNPISSSQFDWHNIKCRFKAPQNTTKLSVAIFIRNKGTVWIDDASLVKLTDTTYNNLSVDLQSNLGGLKKLLGTNTGPVNPYGLQDYTQKFQEIGIDFVRTHDYHIAFDFHVIFPDTSLNPLDPAAYNFTKTDAHVADILKANAKILFRLGESADANVAYRTPPVNMEKWAQVAIQIIKHYNHNWNNGFSYGIKYWEVWNEPDLGEFWNGSLEKYIELYHLTASKIKNYDVTVKVGGPTLACAYDSKWMNTFLDSVVQHKIPLDFFSFHLYDLSNPYNYSTLTKYVKQKLLTANLPNTELILDEWNPYSYNTVDSPYGKDDALNAASTVSSLNYLQNAPIDKLFRYSTDMKDFPLFNWDKTYSTQGYAFKAYGEVLKMDSKLETSGGDSLGTTILAAKSASNNKAIVLIANNSSSSTGYNLDVNGIKNGENWTYQIIRIDSTNEYITVNAGTLTNTSNHISIKVNPPFVDQIRIDLNPAGELNERNRGLNDFEVFPNLFANNLTFLVSGNKQTTIKIWDIFGQIIFQRKFKNSLIVNTAQIAKGVYLYELHNNNGKSKRGKIIKQ